MGSETGIAWTDKTFNHVWGCEKVSPGCAHCYAEAWDKRTGGRHWGPGSERRTFGAKHWQEPRRWNQEAMKRGQPFRVFCASMADVFEDHPGVIDARASLWRLIRETPWLHWQLLTKRPENCKRFLPEDWGGGWANVLLGVTAEDGARWRERVPQLQDTPARFRFVSVEPQVNEIRPLNADLLDIHWLISGGESHQSAEKARPFRLEWPRLLLEKCRGMGVRFFMKQMGSRFAIGLKDSKGGDPSAWPEDLRVREFPDVPTPG